MSEEKKFSIAEAHRIFAINLFNLTWEIIDKADKSQADKDAMINQAHASLYHWSQVGGELNLQRGEWMVSHVYALLSRAEPAEYHATRCLELTTQHNFTDFDLFYAYEAMARAMQLIGNIAEYKKYYELAKKSIEQVKQNGDKNQCIADLAGLAID